MNVYEIRLKVFLLKSVKQEEASAVIASFIDSELSKKEEFKKFHQDNQFKNYVFDQFYPISKEGIYDKEQVYNFRIRTTDRELAEYFIGQLPNHSTACLKGLTAELRIIPRKQLETLFSITPIALKNEEGYWKDFMTFDEYEERLKINLIKKYNAIMDTKIEEDFPLYTMIELINHKPIGIHYKGITLLGDKISVKVSSHPMAQELLYMSLGTGIGEMNSRGLGFLNFRWL